MERMQLSILNTAKEIITGCFCAKDIVLSGCRSRFDVMEISRREKCQKRSKLLALFDNQKLPLTFIGVGCRQGAAQVHF